MRRIDVSTFVSLDGVMQAPGGPEEDRSGGFKYGGWLTAHFDDALGAAIDAEFAEPYDLLLGRRTYDIFAAHWPFIETDPSKSSFDALNAGIAETFNRIAKYVATHSPGTLAWKGSVALGSDVVGRLRALKREEGPRLLVQGSSELLQTLFANDLVDRVKLIIAPVTLGSGKRLFGSGATPAGFRLTGTASTPAGVIVAGYERAGAVATGSFAMPDPTPEELERRRGMEA